MNVHAAQLRRYLPLLIPPAILLGGWLFLVRPLTSVNARAAREIEGLRGRAQSMQAVLAAPPPTAPARDAVAAFERVVAAADATAALLEQLARLASRLPAANLLIETGARVPVAAAQDGPQVTGAPAIDPRFALFDAPLAYSPIEMAFDADYAAVGTFLWDLRDLATTVEIRKLAVKPLPRAAGAADGRVHVTITFFAYARVAQPNVVAASDPGAPR